jgi:signal peptidase I
MPYEGAGVMILSARELMPVICAALQRNQRVRLTVTGSSMFPFIRSGDVVELEPLHGLPGIGDVVLARCPTGERYVLHRVVRWNGEAFFLRGDSQRDWEGPFTRGDLLAKGAVRYRHGRGRRLDRGLWRLLGLTWNRGAPMNVWLFQLLRRLEGKRP